MLKLSQITVQTHEIGDFVEITQQIDAVVRESGVREGIALVRSRHTTAASPAMSRTRASTPT